MVADDDASLRGLWIQALEEAGYVAVGSGDAFDAAELVGVLLPDLILLDLRMPRASGWDLLENMRANPTWRHIPVIVVSAYLHEDIDLDSATGLNVVGQMAKPCGVADLLEAVRRATSGSLQPGAR